MIPTVRSCLRVAFKPSLIIPSVLAYLQQPPKLPSVPFVRRNQIISPFIQFRSPSSIPSIQWDQWPIQLNARWRAVPVNPAALPIRLAPLEYSNLKNNLLDGNNMYSAISWLINHFPCFYRGRSFSISPRRKTWISKELLLTQLKVVLFSVILSTKGYICCFHPIIVFYILLLCSSRRRLKDARDGWRQDSEWLHVMRRACWLGGPSGSSKSTEGSITSSQAQ